MKTLPALIITCILAVASPSLTAQEKVPPGTPIHSIAAIISEA